MDEIRIAEISETPRYPYLGPVIQSVVSLTKSLPVVKNSLSVVPIKSSMAKKN